MASGNSIIVYERSQGKSIKKKKKGGISNYELWASADKTRSRKRSDARKKNELLVQYIRSTANKAAGLSPDVILQNFTSIEQ